MGNSENHRLKSNRNEEQLGQKVTNPTSHGGVKNNRNMFFLKLLFMMVLNSNYHLVQFKVQLLSNCLGNTSGVIPDAVFSFLFVGCRVVERDHMDRLRG